MIEEDWQDNAVSLFQRLLPVGTAVILVLLAYGPVYIDLFNNIRPDLGMIAIYFWMLQRPDLFDLKSVTILGIIDGAVSASAFGLGLFSYLLMYVLMMHLRKYLNGRSFVVIWYGFMALSLGVMIVKWLAASIYHGEFLPILPAMFSYLIGAAIYPVTAMLLAALQNWFLQDDDEL
ncbi:MAG: hypothetical protein IJ184_05390 [Alphaproteobacteria bacterium]|nr:hypothetical protein [Alphaproteobacteria bacterium]